MSATQTATNSSPQAMSTDQQQSLMAGHVSQLAPPPLQPPVPFSEFHFSFDPSLHQLLQDRPPTAPAADLLSATETTNLFGFLDNFDWEFDANSLVSSGGVDTNAFTAAKPTHSVMPRAATTFANTDVDDIFKGLGGSDPLGGQFSHFLHSKPKHPHGTHPYARPKSPPPNNSLYQGASNPSQPYTHSRSDSSSSTSQTSTPVPSALVAPVRGKPLLTDPQKRMNHIMSEQKRRNAIREGYAQLTTLLAPAGAPPGLGMPTRGRPKGSGARGKGRPSAGKSGVLLRAVEYCKWLEEGRDALLAEVRRVETAAGIH